MKRKFYVTQYAVIFDSKKRLLVLRNTDSDPGPDVWVLPGGHIEMETNPIDAIKREIKEETNLKMKSAKAFCTAIRKQKTGYRFIVYYDVKATGKIELSREHDTYKWITIQDTRKMKFRNKENKLIFKLLKNGRCL